MNPLPAPRDMDRSDYVSQTLRQCALLLDPRYGRLSSLSAELDIHETTMNKWIHKGYIPRNPCRRLVKRFGKKWIDLDRLTGN